MNDYTQYYGFSSEEWDSCLKVLNQLKDKPLHNPDNKIFGTLITKVHKQAKKALKHIEVEVQEKTEESKKEKSKKEPRRKSRRQIHKAFDLNLVKASTIVSNAFSKTSFFSHDPTVLTTFTTLKSSKKCYCCDATYYEIHSFYHKLCPSCATKNYAHRTLELDLKGRHIILTGGRVKIGYALALKFLRSGANLTLTSRFPALNLKQLEQEHDYEDWKHRVTVYGLDLRNIRAVEKFIDFYKKNNDSLDILVNNAAQTISYTEEYYQPLIAKEQKFLMAFNEEQRLIANMTAMTDQVQTFNCLEPTAQECEVNRFGQPIDFRDKNSWNSTLTEVSTHELLEVNLINHISPYLLIKAFTPLLKASPFDEKFIINVSSSEGQFSYANKTMYHPHTNMTKSALNMLTRTSALEYSHDNIYMNSVDVGWISTGAIESKRQKLFEQGSVPPLDSVDGMARVIHPIYEALEKKQFTFGKLLKDFKVVEW
ncbi:MAG: Oxidoreductase [uncultured Sulfurovum sp.]|uniref:Oxidoreductase n=1 Tax=uncultured Sulfurovum sp. TaxID=269237 RepID=A0A6S6TTL0_9BACT|nr:MAG: Oxidoreductase [uncultured Sulfurovum sp.]